MRRKLADVITEPKEHQRRVAERIQKQPGLVVAHGMGSGKTLGSLLATEGFGGNADIVVPASLRQNYEKEIAKHVKEPKATYAISSLQELARSKRPLTGKTLIVDEAHRARDASTATAQALANNKAEHRLLLTGSPLYNRPADLSSLVNLAAGDRVLPTNAQDFDKEYVETRTESPGLLARLRGIKPGETRTLKNPEKLKKILDQWVDYHENTKDGFPERRDVTVPVEMKGRQLETYQALIDEAPAWVKYKVERNLPPSKQESKQLNSFLTGSRQAAVSLGAHAADLDPQGVAGSSAKIMTATQRLKERMDKDPAHRAVVYSNFIDAGIGPYETALRNLGINYGKFTGTQTKQERAQMIRDYNEGKTPVLLLSSAGGEGLDLKGTRQVQLLDPHFNKEKIEQVVARAIRYGSHEGMKDEAKNVDVEHYLSTLPEPGRLKKLIGRKRPTSVDEYLTRLSQDKDQLNQQVRALMMQKQAGGLADILLAPLRAKNKDKMLPPPVEARVPAQLQIPAG